MLGWNSFFPLPKKAMRMIGKVIDIWYTDSNFITAL